MNVIYVTMQVILIPDRVLPIPPLPNRRLVLSRPGSVIRLRQPKPLLISRRKQAFDLPNPHRVIGIRLRALDYRMDMLGQQANGQR